MIMCFFLLCLQVKRTNPEKNCFLEYDKLYIDHKIFVFNDALGQVVEQSESQRFGELYSRPGTQMMMAGTAMGTYMYVLVRLPERLLLCLKTLISSSIW